MGARARLPEHPDEGGGGQHGVPLSTRMTAALSVQGLSKRFRITGAMDAGNRTLRESAAAFFSPGTWRRAAPREEVWALSDVSFEVNEGEAFGIIGANGAGKSTLLKILSRITEPTSGLARIRGRVASLLEVGTGFHPELTGRENVFLNGAILGMSRAEVRKKFDEIVAFAEVERFIDTPVKRYSSGMYVRLAFAVAAHLDPEILLVDEVLAVGDVAFQKKCLRTMKDVSEVGRTILFVSHNMMAIRSLCRSAIWLERGALLEEGPSEGVVERYLQSSSSDPNSSDIASQIALLGPDPVFGLKAVRVLQGGIERLSIASGMPLEIEMDYEVYRPTDGLHVYLSLFDMDGSLLFETLHNGDSSSLPRVEAGRYMSRVVIPADFLAPRRYRIDVEAGIANVRGVLVKPVSFVVDVHASGCVNQAYPGYVTPGKLAPHLSWRTERVRSRLQDE